MQESSCNLISHAEYSIANYICCARAEREHFFGKKAKNLSIKAHNGTIFSKNVIFPLVGTFFEWKKRIVLWLFYLGRLLVQALKAPFHVCIYYKIVVHTPVCMMHGKIKATGNIYKYFSVFAIVRNMLDNGTKTVMYVHRTYMYCRRSWAQSGTKAIIILIIITMMRCYIFVDCLLLLWMLKISLNFAMSPSAAAAAASPPGFSWYLLRFHQW